MSSRGIFIIVFTIFTVVVWIGIEVVIGLLSTEIEENYNAYLIPIEPTINTDTIEELQYKEEQYLLVTPEGLE